MEKDGEMDALKETHESVKAQCMEKDGEMDALKKTHEMFKLNYAWVYIWVVLVWSLSELWNGCGRCSCFTGLQPCFTERSFENKRSGHQKK
jgi:hypothetical protein